jgi:hypothetical protein
MKKFTIILVAKRGTAGVFTIECQGVFKAMNRAEEIIKSARAKYTGSYVIKNEIGEELVKTTSLA